MIPSFEQRHSVGGRACPHLGGDSSSQANTTTQTLNTDKRQVLDGGAIGVSSDGSSSLTLTVNSTDAGAVQAGTDVAKLALSNNATNFDHLIAVADSLYSKTLGSLDANVKLAGSLANTAQTAYADAASQAAGNKNLVLVGIAAVALIAVVAFSKAR